MRKEGKIMELVKYDAACRAIAEARNIDEVKGMADKAAAMLEYARQAKNKELEGHAAEIRLRAERRLGQMLKEQRETVGLGKPGRKIDITSGEVVISRPELKELGIDHKLSSRAQQMAAVPEKEFEEKLTELKDEIEQSTSRITTNILKRGEQKERDKNLANYSKPLDGTYSTIVIDPPWEMQKITRAVRPNQVGMDYPTMNYEELKEFPVKGIVAENCMLFLWTTQKHLPFSFDLLEEWGFKYIFTMVWHKPGGIQPYNLPQYNCEFVLFGRKGGIDFLDTKAFPTCFNGARREHSRKPTEFYEMISRVTPGPRIDIFSREKRDGFTGWGNQDELFKR